MFDCLVLFLFLAHLYKCTGRAIALAQASALVVSVWTKYYSLMLKFLCDGPGAVR